MLQIQIDGKQLTVEAGSTVIEAAHQAGTYIPHFCYHKKLSIAANCRMCLVEVEKSPKPLPACATPVTDGMVVKTDSPLAKQARQGVMEFLLINHPLDCPICDQGGECQLQDLAVGYGNSKSRYQEEKRTVPAKDMGPLVSAAEMSRCIHCTRCVRFTEEVAGLQEIGMANRGEFSEIMPFIGKTVETELSGNVIDLCPVGALTSKPFRYDARSWELSRRKTISAHDALGSNLIVQTKDHTVRRVLPLENEAINECWISDRDRFAYEGLYQQRLTTPKIKQDGVWHEVDWKTALDYVVKGLHGVGNDFGRDALAMWVNPASTFEEMFLAKKIADQFGISSIDSRLRATDKALAGSLKGAPWLGQSIEDLAKSDVIVLVGAKLRQEQPLLTVRIRRAAEKGQRVVVVASDKEVLHIPSAVQVVLHPDEWVTWLQSSEAKNLLQGVEKAALIMGAEVQNHPQATAILAAAQQLAETSSATRLGVLVQAANSVGADLLGLNTKDAKHTIVAQMQAPKKAVMLFHVEPDMDTANGASAIAALKEAQTVMAFSAYDSEVLREVADVMLPVATFAETSGSFVNMEGYLQSFHATVKAPGDARPLWKVLRVLGNMLALENFEYEDSKAVLQDALLGLDMVKRLNNQVSGEHYFVPSSGLVRVGGVGIYATDAMVRRSAPLQATLQAKVPVVRAHRDTIAALGLTGEKEVLVLQNQANTLRLGLLEDNRLPAQVVSLPLHQSNWSLGSLLTTIELSKG